jgi:GNAT superfamily N-acetyltransferase
MPHTRKSPESAWVDQHDTLVEPLLAELAHEYSSRYERTFTEQHEALLAYPAEQFAPPEGGLLVLVEDGNAIAGGAFQHYHGTTAELKRIWTHSAHRRRGLALRVVAELEAEAARRGYERIFLTTGPRQPEAKGLYLAAGYTPLFDVAADPQTIGKLPFEKVLTAEAGAR